MLVGVLVVALQCIVVAGVVGPWTRPDVAWDRLADAPNHLVRIFVIDAALGRGEWYPRWLSDLYLGYGYPLLNFYAPATYYVAAALHRLGATIYASFQWTGVLAVALGITGAAALAASARRSRAAALVAGAVYTLAPYPFLTNLYVRAAVPEALALGLLPWLLLATAGTWRRGGVWTPALAALTAATLLTHNVTSLLALGLLACWMPLLAWQGGAPLARAGTRTAAALATGAALSAFFWLPALAESRYVQLDLAQGGLYDFHTWLFDPLGPTRDVARADYPHTRAGPADLALVFDYTALGKALPEKVSLGQLLLWLYAIAAALAGLLLARGNRRSAASGRVLFWAGVALVCWFFSTTWSVALWERAPLLPLIQFPWRFDGPLALCLAMAAAGATTLLAAADPQRQGPQGLGPAASPTAAGGRARNSKPATRRPPLAARTWSTTWAAPAVAAALTALLAYGALAGRPDVAGREPTHDVDVRNVAGLEKNRYAAGTTSGGEFLPQTARWGYDGAGIRRGVRLYDDAYPQAGWQAGLVRVLDGRAAVTAIFGQPHWVLAEVEADTAARIGFHQLLFPGWRAYVDGRPAAVAPAVYAGPIEASLGFMVVDVPAGRHRVEVRFGPTTARLLGSALSAGALAASLFWLAARLVWPSARSSVVARLSRAQQLGGRQRAFAPLRVAQPPPGFRQRALVAGRVLRAAPSLPERAVRPAPPAVAVAAIVVGLAAAGCAAAGAALAARPARGVPAKAARVVFDVAGAVARGEAETQSPAGAGRGPLAPFVDVYAIRIAGEERRWLYMHPPSAAAVRLRVPPHAYLQAGLALDSQTWTQPIGDGVRFIVEAEGAFGRRTLLDRHVHPRARGEDRGWVDVWVDLEAVAGHDVRLVLRTDPVQDASFDWAGWANPQVVIWDAARPDPGTVHQW